MRRALALLLALAPLVAAQDAPAEPRPRAPAPPAANPEPAPEKVVVRRFSDVVTVREGPLAAERVLYYFNPIIEMPQGAQMGQGSGGHTEIKLPGEGLLIIHASAHVYIDKLAPEGDVLDFKTVTRAEAYAGERPLQLLLPGRTTVDVLSTNILVTSEPGRLRIRNEGNPPVRVTSDLRVERDQPVDTPAGRLELQRGEEVRLVLVGGPVEPAGEVVDLWGILPVRHTGDIQVKPEGPELRVTAAGGTLQDETSILTVGGVRVLPRPGLVVRNPRHVQPPPPEPAAVEPPAAEPVPVEPEPPAGETPPPADEEPQPAGDAPR